MQINRDEIKEILRAKLADYAHAPGLQNEGLVVSFADGIVRMVGLSHAKVGEMLLIGEEAVPALVMNLERDVVAAMTLRDGAKLQEGMRVVASGQALQVPVGRALLGRVVNALGEPMDGLGPIEAAATAKIERDAPSVMARHPVQRPFMTGYKAIDAMVPIGQGQRELIIGDRQTGKTTLAIDMILNQSQSGIQCVYVAIGQKNSTVVELVARLKEGDALKRTIVVVASASQSAALQYIAPYAGCSMAEYFRDLGEDALIVYDDLSKHAVAYREISLLLRRPPGREAYPGDIFYLHSRLLERAACVNHDFLSELHPKEKITKRSGSLTAFPIVETQGGDFSGFVSTNVVSITDGQIFLDANLFNAGIRPALDPGISVSRIGGAAQSPILRKVAGGLRTSLAQYRELHAFSQFSSDLEESSREKLEMGGKLTTLLKQKAYAPLSSMEQSTLLLATQHRLFKDVLESQIEEFEQSLLNYMHLHHSAWMACSLNDPSIHVLEMQQNIITALDEFHCIWYKD